MKRRHESLLSYEEDTERDEYAGESYHSQVERCSVLLPERFAVQSGLFIGADERNASHTNTSTQLRLLFHVGRKIEAISLLTGQSQNGSLVVELKNML